MKRELKDVQLVNIFLNRYLKDVLSLNCNDIIESTVLFFEYIPTQEFLNEIQNTLLCYRREIEQSNYMNLSLLFNRIIKNKNLNLDIINEGLIDGILKNYIIMSSDIQVKILSAYAIYVASHFNPNKNMKISANMEEKIKKLYFYGEAELSNSISNLNMDDSIELLNCLFQTGHGSKEFFENIEKHIGKNIESLSSSKLYIVLNTFVLSGKMRPKFTLLLQKRIVELKDKFRIEELTKILRIYTTLETQYEYIYEKCENYLLSIKDYLGYEDLANLVFAYSNPNLNAKYFILNDLEEIIFSKLDKFIADRAFEPIVDILYSYIFCKKGEKKFIEKLSNSIINSNNDYVLSANAYFKLYYCFVDLKIPLTVTTRFDHKLLQKSVNLSKDELISVNTFLKQLNYSNIDTFTIMDNLMKIELSGFEESETMEKKEQLLKDHQITPIYENLTF